MADLIIEWGKRRNLSGLNFSSLGKISAQQAKVKQARIGSRELGVECGLYASQTETAYETKSQTTSKEERQQQATVSLVELAIDLTSTSLCCCWCCCCSIWQSFCLSHFHEGCPALDRALKLIIHAGHVNMIVMPADDGRLTESESKWNLRRHFKHAIDSMYPSPSRSSPHPIALG